jgi:hypothetical protein
MRVNSAEVTDPRRMDGGRAAAPAIFFSSLSLSLGAGDKAVRTNPFDTITHAVKCVLFYFMMSAELTVFFFTCISTNHSRSFSDAMRKSTD